MTELELHIESKYCEHIDGGTGGRQRVLIKVNLPTLRNPLSDIFHEALAGPDYGLSDPRIHELRELVRKGKVELIFLLDACKLSHTTLLAFSSQV